MTDAGQAAQQSSRRVWQRPSTILITGGIGAALTCSYAQRAAPKRFAGLRARGGSLLHLSDLIRFNSFT
jgi:hypothetical protein